MEKDIVFAGFRKDIESTMAAMDVFVLTSTAESCPNAVLEAMAMETPVVVTNVGSVHELIGDSAAASIVECDDVSAVAEAIVQILRSLPQERAAKGRMGRRRVEERFSLERISEQQRSIYEDMLRPLGGPKANVVTDRAPI